MTTDAGAAGTVRSKVNLRAQDPVVRDDSDTTAARTVNVGQRDVTSPPAPAHGTNPAWGSPSVGADRAERGEGFVTALIREAL